MKNYRKFKPFFQTKKCNLCGKPATMFRIIRNKTYMLCNSKNCEYQTRIKARCFSEFNKLKIDKPKIIRSK